MESFRQFCEAVCAQVRCHAVHKEIIRELTAHLEDKADALMARGFSQEEAEAQAVAAMGDPEAVGKELDQVHPPVWGILSGLSGVALLLTGLFLLVAGYGLFLRPVVDTAREFLHVVQAKTQLPDGTQDNIHVIPLDHWEQVGPVVVHFYGMIWMDGTVFLPYASADWNPYRTYTLDERGFSILADGKPLERHGYGGFRLPQDSVPASFTISYDWNGHCFSFSVPAVWKEAAYD